MTKIVIQKSTGQILESYSGIIPNDETIIQNNSSIDESDLEIKTVSPEEHSKIDQDYLKKSKDGYKILRQQEYPSIKELVVALYDADDKAEIDKKRAEIKEKYPKP
jgi:predicted restriction endonuclease